MTTAEETLNDPCGVEYAMPVDVADMAAITQAIRRAYARSNDGLRSLLDERKTLYAERDELRAHLAERRTGADELVAELANVTRERDEARAELENVTEQRDEFKSLYREYVNEFCRMRTQFHELQAAHNREQDRRLAAERDNEANAQHAALNAELAAKRQAEIDRLRELLAETEEERDSNAASAEYWANAHSALVNSLVSR